MAVKITTAQEYKAFILGVKHWMDAFGLTEWTPDFEHEHLDGGTLAQVQFDCQGKGCRFTYAKSVNTDAIQAKAVINSPERLAIHEVLHLLLADLTYTASLRSIDEAVLIGREHEVINRLMRIL